MTILQSDSGKLLAAISALLAEKGIVGPDEIAARMAQTDAANPGQGARMVARAWVDPDYRALMLRDGAQAAEAMGIPMRGLPPLDHPGGAAQIVRGADVAGPPRLRPVEPHANRLARRPHQVRSRAARSSASVITPRAIRLSAIDRIQRW